MKQTLSSQIEQVLRDQPETRDDDILLTIRLWKAFYPQFLFMKEGYDTTIALKNLKHVPSQDDVKRLRAKIQNEEHKYLPTSLEVAKRRGFAEEKWREYLGYGAKKQESNLL